MTVGERIARGDAVAIASVVDRLRDAGVTFRTAFTAINTIRVELGTEPLSLGQFDELLRGVDEGYAEPAATRERRPNRGEL